MKFNLSKKNYEPKQGDIIISHASDYHYMIVSVHNKEEKGFTLVCLDDAESTHQIFSSVSDLIQSYFSEGKFDLIPKEQLMLTNIE